MYKEMLLELMNELHAQDILEDILRYSDIHPAIAEFWRELHPRDGGELYEIMKDKFTNAEIEIITKDLDFDL